jgi:predicted dehydrogenase/threonine dehydrogenase-like Zn-dependent dehydrogenase
MRQVLLNSRGAVVARVPRPAVEPGAVLVRTRYSLISVGTEVASLRPKPPGAPDATLVAAAREGASLAKTYLAAAWRDPRRAVRKAASLARQGTRRLVPAPKPAPVSPAESVTEPLRWQRMSARSVETGPRLRVVTDASPADYQIVSQVFALPASQVPLVRLRGRVERGAVSIGLLNGDGTAWLGSRSYGAGEIDDELAFARGDTGGFQIVCSTAGAGESVLVLDEVEVLLAPVSSHRLPHSELDDQGWNVGYSLAGEVVAVGAGVTDFSPGDRVACAGAGQANHADYVSVRRNLVVRLPQGCPFEVAAFGTVGAIALQGVRRAAPQLGEIVCVLGLGLIGQITVQLLRAAGCRVIGLDLAPTRVARAIESGLEQGASDADTLKRAVRDLTGGHGADRTLITAATRSDDVVNLAMEVTRRRGAVVIVGDVGLGVRREEFYRKEIDLLMSTSYGPGRYDRTYEVEGRDYPYSYVRWTMNRNLEAVLELASTGRLDLKALIDRVIPIHEAADAYRELAGAEDPPLGVLLSYPDDERSLPEPADATRVTIRGHRAAPEGRVHYALVGAGAFGTSMLVPQMEKRADVFFLRAVVSRNAPQAGNFARANRVEILASDLADVLGDPSLGLVVIATRHHEHASQVVRALNAGKHVFVEKPLALTWPELDSVVRAYEAAPGPPLLMVGFNRRFSPALQGLGRELTGRRTPLVMSYRVNGGFIPQDHWIQGPEGGGRNLGEACHMYDVFRMLAGSRVVDVSAHALSVAPPYQRNDNFIATLKYEDGSVAGLTYTASGPKAGMPKERLEVFCGGEAYVVDDFKRLQRASDGAVLWEAAEADKGHREELSRFADALRGALPPIPLDEIVETTAVALQVEDLLFGRYEDETGAEPQG